MIKTFETKLGQSVKMTELYDFLGLNKSQYSRFVKKEILESLYFEVEKDYSTCMSSNSKVGYRGQFRQEIDIHIDAAKKLCMISKSAKGNEIRNELVLLTKQRETLEHVTIKEAAFAVKVINCLKYIENQKDALALHQETFKKENINVFDEKYIYSEFYKYRTKITGWDKAKVDETLNEYLKEHIGYPKKVKNADMPTKLSIIDIGEAIRIAVLDILFAKHETNQAYNFSEMCKKLAIEMGVEPEKGNQKNLFHNPEIITDVKQLIR